LMPESKIFLPPSTIRVGMQVSKPGVSTETKMSIMIFWDVTQCSRLAGGYTAKLHL
jgi:hypothetical protein